MPSLGMAAPRRYAPLRTIAASLSRDPAGAADVGSGSGNPCGDQTMAPSGSGSVLRSEAIAYGAVLCQAQGEDGSWV